MIGQLAEIHANAFKDGEKKDLYHALIHLDEGKFLEPDFAYNKENVAYAMVNTIIVLYDSNLFDLLFLLTMILFRK